MAYDNHRWAWTVVGLRGSTYNVLHCLVESANGKGIVDRLSLKFISRRCNISRERTQKCIRDLAQSELIQIIPRTTVTGQKISNGYVLNRNRFFPAILNGNEEHDGRITGRMMWTTMRLILKNSLAPEERDLIDNQFREAYFDISERATKIDQRKGVLYLFAETDMQAVKVFKKKCLNKLLAKREEFPPYLIEYIEPVRPIHFEEADTDDNPDEL